MTSSLLLSSVFFSLHFFDGLECTRVVVIMSIFTTMRNEICLLLQIVVF